MLDYIKNKILVLTGALLLSNYSFALSPNNVGTIGASYLLVENMIKNEYFMLTEDDVSATTRMTGVSKWNSEDVRVTIDDRQDTKGYMGNKLWSAANRNVDMWIDDSFANSPFLGLGCFKGANCPAEGFISPALIDAKGFYKAQSKTGETGGANAYATLSLSGYAGLSKLAVGATESSQFNWCTTTKDYNPSSGGRCKDQSTGTWNRVNFNHTKIGHLKLRETGAFTEVWIATDGTPFLQEKNNQYCEYARVDKQDGIICKIFVYDFLSSIKLSLDLWFSLLIDYVVLGFRPLASDIKVGSGISWHNLHQKTILREYLKEGNNQYITFFFSPSFFARVVENGGSVASKDSIFTFKFFNEKMTPTPSYYLPTGNALGILPRDYGISIRPEPDSEGLKLGDIGSNAPIDFNYKVTVTGPRNADKITAQVLGASGSKDGQNYCVFKPIDKLYDVLIPSFLSYMDKNNQRLSRRSSCGDTPISFKDAIWSEVPWDVAGSSFYYTTMLKLSFPMNDKVSQLTQAGKTWEGQVYAEGTVKVKAEWLGVP